jgi:hypothetical protein
MDGYINDPQKRLDDMLQRSGAVLVRQAGPHRVFGWPDGHTIPFSKTPSDYRAVHRQISSLKRKLRERGVTLEESTVEANSVKIEVYNDHNDHPIEPLAEHKDVAPNADSGIVPQKNANQFLDSHAVPTLSAFAQRLQQAIQHENILQDQLIAASDLCDQRKKILALLEPYANDPMLVEILLTLLPQPSTPIKVPAPVPIAPTVRQTPPKPIVQRVPVTKELVWSAVEQLSKHSSTFTIGRIAEILTGSGEPDHIERLRIRHSINNSLEYLLRDGRLEKECQGRPGRGNETLWKKAGVAGHAVQI